ncbi:hypothetical protein BG004_005210 [Podila humilis]|nr:hypothetical protein BG004_005210 [Podila humilis]
MANPFDDNSTNGNCTNIIIVNSDIMIGQHESQTDEEFYSDNDSETASSTESPIVREKSVPSSLSSEFRKKTSQYNPHGYIISQQNLPPSTTIKPISFFGRFTKSNKGRHKGDSLQLLHQNDSRNRSPRDSTTPPEMNSAAASKNNLVLDRRQITEKGEQESGPLPSPVAKRKRGIPGKNGEEPETDMFNFVDIMLDMPEEPTWRGVIIKMLKVLAVMTISYFALMSLYFAAEFQAADHMKNIEVIVVNLDEGMVGAQYISFVDILNNQTGQLNWSVRSKDTFKTLDVVKEHVQSGAVWGAVVIMPNTSSNLNKMLSTPLESFDPSGAFAFVYDGGRDPLVVKPHIVANMYTSFLQFSKLFNPLWIKFTIGLYTREGINITNLMQAPHILGTPVAFTEYDLHPPTAAIITSATSVAYIWIFLVAGGSTYLVANMVQPLTKRMSVSNTMLFVFSPLMLFLGTLSLTYTILLLAFSVPFKDGATQFLSLFGGMLLLQMAVSSMVLFLIFLIPVVYIPMITITFVILNVIAVFNPVELMPAFYRWVYAMPFLNAVQISRHVLMGSYNRLQYNLPVLAIWIVVPWAMLPFAIGRQKRIARENEVRSLEEEQFQLQQLRLHNLQPKDSTITAVEVDTDNQDEVSAQRRHIATTTTAAASTITSVSESPETARTGGRVRRQSVTMTRGRHGLVSDVNDDNVDNDDYDDDDNSVPLEEDDERRRQRHQHQIHHPSDSTSRNRPPLDAGNIPYQHFYQPPPPSSIPAPYVLPPFNRHSSSSPPLNVYPSAPTESQVFNTRPSHSNRIDVPARRSSMETHGRYQQQHHQYPSYDNDIPTEVK